jgi:hypothetical protein
MATQARDALSAISKRNLERERKEILYLSSQPRQARKTKKNREALASVVRVEDAIQLILCHLRRPLPHQHLGRE